MVAARVARTRVRVNVGDMPYAKGRNGAGPEVSDPVITAHLIRPIGHELIALLRNLDADAWSRATSAPGWTVKDVVAHMLDVELRRVSIARDGFAAPAPDAPIADYADLLRYLNGLNADWVRAARRVSPRALTDHLELACNAAADVLEAADPSAEATYPVAWAGQTSSPMWLDIGREYTERWHHQDQIREAVGAPPLQEERLLRAALEISLFALPHAYRGVSAEPGTSVHVNVTGEAGGDWHLAYDSGWQLGNGKPANPATTVRVADLDLTRLLMHRIAPDRVSRKLEVSGDARYATPLIAARAVMV